ncbi:oxaloacetate decarboxylase [Microbacterium sp. SLBN-146]|uniref:isocitrate lyase/PEP mutase family protein n=1 Tax=Microbacterium sp. SLBN-146 TaxID=2768457 RepID=UPI001172DC2C|nr:isocitrate lyase/phosphoenolpyruvate mutase family protein [Microbacterium sp. SLBN-146]TQJ30918.1 methylisocitrate lyase [Microbacterium sp. SLBN-146]
MPESRIATAIREAGGTILLPGVGTPLEALAAQSAGATAAYVSGYATAAWRHGLPDIGIIALAEITESLRAVTAVVDIPVIVDADTGYGDVVNVARAVERLESSGAAGIQLEDQTWPKRCGHLRGKSVEPTDVMVRKIRAAVRARADAGTLIVARTDARAPYGIAEAIDRARRYHDAGADALFIDAPESEAEVEQIAREVPGILVANMSESGLTPMLSRERFAELGYGIVLYPTSSLRIASDVFVRFFRDLLADGDSSAWVGQMSTLGTLNSLVGIEAAEHLEAAVLGEVGQ